MGSGTVYTFRLSRFETQIRSTAVPRERCLIQLCPFIYPLLTPCESSTKPHHAAPDVVSIRNTDPERNSQAPSQYSGPMAPMSTPQRSTEYRTIRGYTACQAVSPRHRATSKWHCRPCLDDFECPTRPWPKIPVIEGLHEKQPQMRHDVDLQWECAPLFERQISLFVCTGPLE
jgi:hypothetical protein